MTDAQAPEVASDIPLWVVDDWRLPDVKARQTIDLFQTVSFAAGPPLHAVKLRQTIVHDVQKWFGGAQIRLDALVVTGNGFAEDPASFYMPGTFRFPDVRDHEQLPIDTDGGLLLFAGVPLHFIDIFILVSRDDKDSDDLASLLSSALKDKKAIAPLLALALTSPGAAAVTAAIGAVGALGNIAYQVVRAVSPKTVGMYRVSFLQFTDQFGVGRHPKQGSFREHDLEFWYEIIVDDPGISID